MARLLLLLSCLGLAFHGATGAAISEHVTSAKSTSRALQSADINTGTNGSASSVYPEQNTLKTFSFLVNRPAICAGELTLIIVVCSAVGHFDQRNTIRKTWGSVSLQPGYSTKIVYLLGQDRTLNVTDQARVQEESNTFHDIIQADFTDTYNNLTLKSIAMLQWVHSYCRNAKYVLKTDDDSFINIPVLIKDLRNCVHTYFLMGDILAAAKPSRDTSSKYFTPSSVYKEHTYPKYMSGSAYIISQDLIYNLYNATQALELFWIEDVYITGLCANKVKAKFIFNGKFAYRRRELDPCYFKKAILGHGLDVDQLERIWNQLTSPSFSCDIEIGKAYVVA